MARRRKIARSVRRAWYGSVFDPGADVADPRLRSGIFDRDYVRRVSGRVAEPRQGGSARGRRRRRYAPTRRRHVAANDVRGRRGGESPFPGGRVFELGPIRRRRRTYAPNPNGSTSPASPRERRGNLRACAEIGDAVSPKGDEPSRWRYASPTWASLLAGVEMGDGAAPPRDLADPKHAIAIICWIFAGPRNSLLEIKRGEPVVG